MKTKLESEENEETLPVVKKVPEIIIIKLFIQETFP